MFLRNPGRFRYKCDLLKPGLPERDELGGLRPAGYAVACTAFGLVTKRSQVRQEFIGDYVTSDTRYFIFRDLSLICPDLDTSWRLQVNGVVYQINDVTIVDDSVPNWVQITATANTGKGGF